MPFIHQMKDGNKISVTKMSDSHLSHTIKLIERKAKEGITVHDGGGSCPDDYWFTEDHYAGTDALKMMNHHEYVAEQERRKKGESNVTDNRRTGGSSTSQQEALG